MQLLSKVSDIVQNIFCLYVVTSFTQLCHRRRSLKSTLQPTIFWELVKFVDLSVLYFSLVLPV